MNDLRHLKDRNYADGYCGVCGNRVPSTSLNKFYCLSGDCNYRARKFFADLEAQEKYGDDEE